MLVVTIYSPEGVEAPSVLQTRVQGGQKASCYHDDVCDDYEADLTSGQASKKRNVEQKQRRSEEPVDVTSVEDLSLGGATGRVNEGAADASARVKTGALVKGACMRTAAVLTKPWQSKRWLQ